MQFFMGGREENLYTFKIILLRRTETMIRVTAWRVYGLQSEQVHFAVRTVLIEGSEYCIKSYLNFVDDLPF